MNRTQAAKFLPAITAYAEGKSIQVRSEAYPEWKDIDHPSWHYLCEYRIKPEPKEIWVNEYSANERYGYATKEEANENSVPGRLSCKLYREVIEN